MLGMTSIWHWLIVLVIVLVIFGPGKLPQIGEGLGKGIREFKDATNDIKQELNVNAPPAPRQPLPPAQPPVQAQPSQPVASEAQPVPQAPDDASGPA